MLGLAILLFFDNRKYSSQLADALAGACILAGANATPYRSFAQALYLFYPEALRSKAAVRPADASMLVHPTARIGNRVVLEPGAVVGREATIGDGTTIAAGAVIGFRVALG